MRPSDWAEEALEWFESYHSAVRKSQDDEHPAQVNTSDNEETKHAAPTDFAAADVFFGDCRVDDAFLARVLKHPVLRHVNLLEYPVHDFEAFEQARGWLPLLTRLPKVADYRLLTMLRRSLLLPMDDPTNQALVSRHQWTVIEGLRWKLGYYHRPGVQCHLEMHAEQTSTDEKDPSPQERSTYLDHAPPPAPIDASQWAVRQSEGAAGRFVVYEGSETISPGTLLWQQSPLAHCLVDPLGNASTTCVFCQKRRHDAPTVSFLTASADRRVALDCDCDFAFCSQSCREQHEAHHKESNECTHVRRILEQSKEQNVPGEWTMLVYRACQRLANDSDAGNDSFWSLATHQVEYQRGQPELYGAIRCLANWMVEMQIIATHTASQIEHLYLSIPVNAFGLGATGEGVGLFGGWSPLLNHSCLPNATHVWNSTSQCLEFRAIAPIQPGEEVTHSYASELELSTAERTQYFNNLKFFTCTCSRCASEDEQGRLSLCLRWKGCRERLRALEEPAEKATASTAITRERVDLYRQMVDLSKSLFPPFYVTKGWAYEELGRALLDDNDFGAASQAMNEARTQYLICYGPESDLVHRVENLQVHQRERAVAASVDEDTKTATEDDEDSDLKLLQGWSKVLLEIKTFETTTDWKSLATAIQKDRQAPGVLEWNPGYRLYELGFGIQTLILSCQINESCKDRTALAEEIQQEEEDIIQNVDVLTSRDYAY
jgi:translation elongation factor EF-1beta